MKIKGFINLSLSLFLGLILSQPIFAKRYIVKMKSDLVYKSMKHQVQGNHFRFTDQNNFQLMGQNTRMEGSLDGLKMFIIETEDASEIKQLKASGDIAFIEEEYFLPAPKFQLRSNVQNFSRVPFSTRANSPYGIDVVKAPGAWAQGVKGQDVRVLVLDTGIDRDHEDLMGRLEKAKNYAFTLGQPPYDYFDNIGHGTHVAGTILADGTGSGLLGVAPEARLLVARVCSLFGCSSVDIIEAVNWGIQEKVDIINLSLGGSQFSEAEKQAYKDAEAAGIVVIAASGNNGTEVQGSIFYPAAHDSVLSVGAIDQNKAKADFSQYSSQLDVVAPGVMILSAAPVGTGTVTKVEVDFKSGKGLEEINSIAVEGSGQPENPVTSEYIYVDLAESEDVAHLDLTGKIALIRRGQITFKEKVDHVISKGAIGAIIFNNEEGLIQAALGDPHGVDIPVVMIDNRSGEALALLQFNSITMNLSPSDFSFQSGTSMAAPHVSGVAALIKSANKNLSTTEIKQLLKMTSEKLTPNTNNEFGAGLVNAREAVTKALSLSHFEDVLQSSVQPPLKMAN